MILRNAYALLTCVVLLLTIGIVMLFSASAYAQDAHGDIYFFIKRQGVWLILGVISAVIVALLDYDIWRRICWPLYGATVLLLALCFIHGVGSRINGSWRWVHFGPLTFQPSEIAKFASVLVIAHWYSSYEQQSSRFLRGFVLPMVLVSVPMLLILREEDMGTALLIGVVAVALMFVAGGNLLYMASAAAILAGGIYFKASHNINRSGRMTAFLDLEKHKEGFGLQQWESLKAFSAGGLQGVGLGDSREKMHYLPYAHTDFIFPIIGEELGLQATVLIVLAFLVLALSGIHIAMRARDRFGMLLAYGAVLTVTFQAVVNIGVTTALLPNKGMPLPFISAGGSNLCVCLLFIGVLVSVSRKAASDSSRQAKQAVESRPKFRPAMASARLRKRTPARRVSSVRDS